jgi:hypothetical protein
MNVTDFQQVLSDLESSRPFPHRRALWSALAETQWGNGTRSRAEGDKSTVDQ